MPDKISVMLVDDSTVIRSALRKILNDIPAVEIVASVGNGEMGVNQASTHKPDIVILDVEMPVMDGLTALPAILKTSPKSKVLMFSTLTAKGADITIRALGLGAVECLLKPTSVQGDGDLEELKQRLKLLIKTLYARKYNAFTGVQDMASAAVAPSAENDAQGVSLLNDPAAYKGKPSLITIGSSTGGPNALFEVCQHLCDLSMPIVITQHMPATFTKILAQHITERTKLPTFEAEDGMLIEAGKAYVAPGGYHMVFEQDAMQLRAKLLDTEPVNFCKPAVDPMISSAVDVFGSRILGAILTGMGSDGLGGCRALVQAKGRLIAQDEATSTVWGMPRAVAMEGICEAVLPLKEIGPWIRSKSL